MSVECIVRRVLNRKLTPWWLFALSVSLLALAPGVLGAPEAPGKEDVCPLDPAYLAWRAGCAAADLHPRGACAWAPVLDHVFAGRRGDAEAALGRAFDLPAAKASALLGAATFFAPLLLTSQTCLMEEAPGLMEIFQQTMKQAIKRNFLGGHEGFEVVGRLCELDARVLAEVSSRAEADETLRRGVERAAQGFADLFADSVGLGRPQWMLARIPNAGRNPGLYPTARVWDPSLRDIAPHLEELDRALGASVESTKPAERFRRLARAIDAMPSDRIKAFAWTRAGVGLLVLGRPIEAWTALAWAEDRYRRLDPEEIDALVDFGRYLARSHQLIAAMQLLMLPEAFRLMEEIGSSDSALEKRLSELSYRILSGDPKVAVRASFEAFEDDPLAPEQQRLFLLGLEIMLPGMAGSLEAVAAEESALESFAGSEEGQPSSFTAIPEAWILHGVEAGLRTWQYFARLAPHWSQAVWPAGMMRRAWDEDGDAYLVRRVIAAIVDFYEQDLDPLWADELVRGALDAQVSRFYPAAFELSVDAGAPAAESFAYTERARAFALRRLLGLPPDASSWPSPRESELEAEIVGAVHEGAPSAQLDETRSRFASARLERKLLDTGAELPDFPAPVDLATLQQEVLLENETLLAYFPGMESLHVLVVRRHSFERRRVDWPLEDLEKVADHVETARWIGTPPEACRELRGAGLCPNDVSTGSESWLYERLVAPVADLLPAPSLPPGEVAGPEDGAPDHSSTDGPAPGRLVIVPWGELHRVPWAALRSPGGARLVEEHEIVVVPSADSLTSLRRRRPVRDSSPATPALVLGDPELDDPELGDSEMGAPGESKVSASLPPLAGARREAREVAEFFGVEPLLGARASEAALLAGARDARVLHIAAHGIYESKHPLFSRLHLAAGDGRDGFLHTHEIWDRLQLCKARLVVLSACDSAAGERSGGDDLVGLTQAFLVAGAPAVVSTLWPVDDPASAALMTTFYRHFRDGETAGAALRLAQIELLRTEEHAAPHYWAGYVLVGDAEARWQEGTP